MKNSEKFWSKMSYSSKKELIEQVNSKDHGEIIKYLSPTDCVLDFGCGNGVTDIALSNQVKEIHGIDTSSGMIEVANANLDYMKISNCHFTQMDLSNDALTNRYNVVLTMSVLQYIEDLEGTINRIAEILLQGGYFISTAAFVGEKRSFTISLLQRMSRMGIIPGIYARKVREMSEMMATAGLELVEVTEISKKYAEYFIVSRKA